MPELKMYALFTSPGQSARANDLRKITVATELYALPLDTLLVMVQRLAVGENAVGTGTMESIGGVANFSPDSTTFKQWLASYQEKVRSREYLGDAEL